MYRTYKCLLILSLLVSVGFTLASGALARKLYLKSGTIDTKAIPSIAASGSQNEQGAGHYLVQLKGPVTDENKQVLADAGAQLLEYVPDFAFMVRIDHSRIGALRKLDCVEWVGSFKAEHKQEAKPARAKVQSQYLIRLFPGANSGFIRNKVKALRAKYIDCADRYDGAICRILADQNQISSLAALDTVAWVEPYIQPQLCNNVAQGIYGLPEVRQEMGLHGAGQIIGAADTGLDTGDPGTLSADFSGRISKAYALRRPGDWSDISGHGTHTMGSLLGSGVLSGSIPTAHNYNGSFAGVAPEARLVFQSIGDSGQFVFPPLHLSELFQPTYDDGARVHSNSWGSAASGQYTVYSNEVDQFIWDHKGFTAVFAVGNEAKDVNQDGIIDKDSLYAPATAKNCISVGASESLRTTGGYQQGYGVLWAADYPASPIRYDFISNNITGMAAFSGRGPTDDGRVKPDICAPGTNIVSCRSHISGASTGWGVYDANYIYWGGTSMSTPQVAGAAALVREYYQREKGINPSAALIKATLLSGAADMSPGQYGTGARQESNPVPDFSQGWGRLDLKTSLYPDQPLVNEFADESSTLSTGGSREYQYAVVNNSVPLKITLTWTDYPGSVVASKELVNDLDLTVVSPSGVIYISGGSYDRANNVEQVRIMSPEVGAYTVRVSGYNVPMGPQDYALVVSGGLPNTYIAGAVMSSSGAPVQGALISVVSAAGTRRVTTNSSGKYMIRVNPATYSVQIGKPGWAFTPSSRIMTVEDTSVDNANFQGHGAPGSAAGTITSVIGGIVSYVTESSHPYLNNMDQTYVITANEGVTRMRVHFAEIDVINDGDTIYVLDGTDTVKSTLTGKGEDIWSNWVNGNVIKIRIMTNDYGNIGYGFYADGYETDLVTQGSLGGAVVTLTPGNYKATTAADGKYLISNVPPGTYTLTPSMPHWKFQPGFKNIEIPAGGPVSGVNFQAFPPGLINGEVRISSSVMKSTNVESPHPYPDNYSETWQITADPSTSRMRLHFDKMTTEPAFDFIYIMDQSDNIIEIYTADNPDLWTPWINGNVAMILFTSDEANNDYGFRCDKYEAQTIGAGLAGVQISMSPDSRSFSSSSAGTFSIPDADVGNHTLMPSLSPWAFDPPYAQVSTSAGMEQTLFFYAKVGEMTLPAQVKQVFDGIQVTLKGVAVSAVFNGFFYVEDSTRASGIRVVSAALVKEGDIVTITGTMATQNGERRIIASSVSK